MNTAHIFGDFWAGLNLCLNQSRGLCWAATWRFTPGSLRGSAGTGAVAQRNSAVAAGSTQLVGWDGSAGSHRAFSAENRADLCSSTTASWTCWCEGPLEQGKHITWDLMAMLAHFWWIDPATLSQYVKVLLHMQVWEYHGISENQIVKDNQRQSKPSSATANGDGADYPCTNPEVAFAHFYSRHLKLPSGGTLRVQPGL